MLKGDNNKTELYFGIDDIYSFSVKINVNFPAEDTYYLIYR